MQTKAIQGVPKLVCSPPIDPSSASLLLLAHQIEIPIDNPGYLNLLA